MRVFGIDCGTEFTGWGVVEMDHEARDPRLTHCAAGTKSAHITHLPGTRNDTRITDEGLKKLPRSLTDLGLYGDIQVTDAGIKYLSAAVRVTR